MSGNLKMGLAIFLFGALIVLNFFTGFTEELFQGYKMSRIFIPVFIIGVIGIWIIAYKMEKKDLQ